MQKYKHIFFDLDRTLWDFDSNSAETLIEILKQFKLSAYVDNVEKWTSSYNRCNKQVWDLFDKKKLNKQELRLERFRMLFDEFNIQQDELIPKISEYFIANSPSKSRLMPHVMPILKYLSKRYMLHIVSNGFYDVQLVKLKAGGINKYFKTVVTSDKVLAAKPDKRIFQEAVKAVNARKDQSVFVGDSFEKDIMGAKKFGMDQIWYNHDNVKASFKPSSEIKSLIELKNIL